MAVKDIRWVHKITLPDGTVTPGEWALGLDEWGLSQLDFKNKRVLDIGCLDGGYSFFAEAQGAKEVVSIDIIEARKNKVAYPQAAYTNEAYLYAHGAFTSQAKYVFPFSIYDVTPEEFGTFDIVFFLGVLYHLAHPLLALEKINRVLKPGGVVAIETEISRSFTSFYHAMHLQHTVQSPHRSVPIRSLSRRGSSSMATGRCGPSLGCAEDGL